MVNLRYFSDFGGLCDSLMNFCHKITFFKKKKKKINSISWNFFITTHYHYSTFVLSHILMLIFFFDFFPQKKSGRQFFQGHSLISLLHISLLAQIICFKIGWLGKKLQSFLYFYLLFKGNPHLHVYIYVYKINIIYLILHIGISCRLSMTHQVSD